jgi:hypothetical protein
MAQDRAKMESNIEEHIESAEIEIEMQIEIDV